jgi:HD-GYP domain-containing protein (c-di-GMP phosphodiesterase class II)
MNRQVLAGLNSIKTHDNYTFQHSIDVTIMGMVLARRAGWDAERQRAFGIGCILHDIGKIFIDQAILNKPGQLSDEEFAMVKTHPGVGYELIKAIAPNLGVLAPQVALQHHEREDGRGYPRGLKGDNTLGQNKAGMIHEFGSLCAVADVYDALTSDRCYRRGWPTDRTVNFIVESARTSFCLEAVQIFAKVAAPFPVCCEVRVRNGKYAGHIGVVSDVSEIQISRPKVRLMYNQYGARIDPLEIDMRVEQDINVDCVDRGDAAGKKAMRRAG